jgi:hypothetical protein
MTAGGRHPLEPVRPSDEIVQKGVHLAIVQDGMHALATARPDGNERITSFFPAPFRMLLPERDELADRIKLNQERLTVKVDEDSTLAAEIAGYRQRAG